MFLVAPEYHVFHLMPVYNSIYSVSYSQSYFRFCLICVLHLLFQGRYIPIVYFLLNFRSVLISNCENLTAYRDWFKTGVLLMRYAGLVNILRLLVICVF